MASQSKMKNFLIWDQQYFLSRLSVTSSFLFTYLTLNFFFKFSITSLTACGRHETLSELNPLFNSARFQNISPAFKDLKVVVKRTVAC